MRPRQEQEHASRGSSLMNGAGARFILEERFDRLTKEARDFEGERQARVVLARLDGIDALARHVEPFRQLGLTPVAFGA